jgi:hypothetical protein
MDVGLPREICLNLQIKSIDNFSWITLCMSNFKMNFSLQKYETLKNKHVERESRTCLTYSARNNQDSSKTVATRVRGPCHAVYRYIKQFLPQWTDMRAFKFRSKPQIFSGSGYRSRYSDSLLAGRSGDRIPVGARFSANVLNGPRAHPVSCTMGTGCFPGVKRPGRGVGHPPHLALRLKKE